MTWRKEGNYRKREEMKVRRKKMRQVCKEGMKWMEEQKLNERSGGTVEMSHSKERNDRKQQCRKEKRNKR